MKNCSNITNNSKNESIDLFNVLPPVPCWNLYIIGVYLVLLFISSIVFNSLFLLVVPKNKKKLTPVNCLMITLSVLNFFGTILQMPLVIYSAFNCKFSFGKFGCSAAAFIFYFVGCANIYLLAAISLERFVLLNNPVNGRRANFKLCFISIAICLLLSLMWASLPLIGWSHYSLEGVLITCGVEWHERTLYIRSYNLSLCVFAFACPLLVIIISNTKVICIVDETCKRFKRYKFTDKQIQKRFEKQKNITLVTMIFIIMFIVSWTPYAFVSFYQTFINADAVTPILATLPGLLGKSCFVWPSLLNVTVNKSIYKYLPCFKKINRVVVDNRKKASVQSSEEV